jgi:hypothetical protein
MVRLKRAVLFSIISLLIVILFATITSLLAKIQVQETELDVTRTKVKVLNSLINDMNTIYFNKIIYVSSKNALIGISRYYHLQGIPHYTQIESPVAALNKAMKNGRIRYQGSLRDLTLPNSCGTEPCINYSYTVEGLMDQISDLYLKNGLNITKFDVTVLNLRQTTPWEIEVETELNYHFADQNNIVSWKGATQRTVNISVYGVYASYGGLQYKDQSALIDNSWQQETKVILGIETEADLITKLRGRPTDGSLTIGICPAGEACYT